MTMLTALRRTVVALGLAGLVATYLRLNGANEQAPGEGGWRELTGDDLD